MTVAADSSTALGGGGDPDTRARPVYPEGADLMVRTTKLNDAFWNRHPHVERYRLEIKDGHAGDLEQNLLIWLRPSAAPTSPPDAEVRAPLDRPADLDLTFDTAHDGALLADHPDVLARHLDLQVNAHADGAEQRLRLWLHDSKSA